jgi:dTDP-4-amino-4,6-dideoxygalactose transaminase
MRVPLLDLKAQYQAIRRDTERAVEQVFAEQQFVLGATVDRFEREMQSYTGARHAIGVASGSDALLLALMALDIGPGDAVVTSPFTFFATGGSIVRTGARLVFADIDPATFNISPEAARSALADAAHGAQRLVLMPVHLFGRLAPMKELGAAAAAHGATIVEDAAQALGARSDAGESRRMAGTYGALGALSFFPSKNLGAAGDAGMVLSTDDSLGERVRMLRTHGSVDRYVHERVGVNSRLDALQAAVLSVKLLRLDAWCEKRRERAAVYSRRFHDADLRPPRVRVPETAAEAHVFHQYVIRAERRDELRAALAASEIETQIYYPLPLHLQPCFAALGFRPGQFPEAERASRESLALPMYPEITDAQLDHVVDRIATFYRER